MKKKAIIVARYIKKHGVLPDCYISKEEAKSIGWRGGSIEALLPGYLIGGSRFHNYESKLPEDDYYECDFGTLGKSTRGKYRLVYSIDKFYYTSDHYQTFEEINLS